MRASVRDDYPDASAGLGVRHYFGCLVRLSESLRMRADRGDHQRYWGEPTWSRSCTAWPIWNRSTRSAATP